VDGAGNLIPGPRAIIEFDAVTEGLASPVLRQGAPGFVGGGFTAGGAREFVIRNPFTSRVLTSPPPRARLRLDVASEVG